MDKYGENNKRHNKKTQSLFFEKIIKIEKPVVGWIKQKINMNKEEDIILNSEEIQ